MKIWNAMIAIMFVASSLQTEAQTNISSESVAKAQRLFERLTGNPLTSRYSKYKEIVSLIDEGFDLEAAQIITEDPYFYQTIVKNMAASMSNKSETPFVPLDDFQATFIGAVRDELDARTLLTGNYIYRAEGLQLEAPSRRDNNHYERIDAADALYSWVLIKQEPQWQGMRQSAGLLTTRAWAKAHYSAGTNRRAVQYAFQEFLCLPIDSWKVAGLVDTFVGRDVDRAPGKDASVYQEQCRTCHGGMDAMRGAFAYLDYLNEAMVELPEGRPAPKYSAGAGTYPQGYVTTDDSWVNPIASHQPTIGFNLEQTKGKGINAFGAMLANTDAFRECMASRIFAAVCQRSPEAKDRSALNVIARNFAQNGFNLKRLFQEIAVLPACLGD